MARISAMANVNLEDKRLSGFKHLAELDKREEYEQMVRKRMIEEREQQKKKKNVASPLESVPVPEFMTRT